LDDGIKVEEYGIDEGDTIRMTGRLKGGVGEGGVHVPEHITSENAKDLFKDLAMKLEILQKQNESLKEEVNRNSHNTVKGIRKVIQSGNKELAPKKFQSTALSGSFKTWAREVKDFARMADPAVVELMRHAEIAEGPIKAQDIIMEYVEMDKDLHYFITRFLDGEAKLLALNAEIGQNGVEHKSGSELWRLLTFNYEKRSAYNIVHVVEMIKNVEKAKTMADVQAKISTLQRLYIEFAKGFMESDDGDIGRVKKNLESNMVTIGYFDVFKKSDLFRILPENVMKDLRRSPEMNLEKISYNKLVETITQMVKDSNTAPVPMDLDALKEDKEEEANNTNANNKNEESPDVECGKCEDESYIQVYGSDGSLYYISPKGKGKGKGEGGKGSPTFDGNCLWCGRYGHRLRDCRAYTSHMQKGGAPMKGKGKGEQGKGDGFRGGFSKGYGKGDFGKGKSYGKGWNNYNNNGKGGFANAFGNEYAPNPVPVHNQPQSMYPQLMATPWQQGYVGSLCQMNIIKRAVTNVKNKYQALAKDEEEDDEDYWHEFPKINETKPTEKDMKVKKVVSIFSYEHWSSPPTCLDYLRFQEVVRKKVSQKERKMRIKKEKEEDNMLACLLAENEDHQGRLNQLDESEWEQVRFMVDSGASETVASTEKFKGIDLVETTITGTEYSAAGSGGKAITNMGEKRLEVMDENGTMSFMKVQMCDGLNPKKFLASVSRMNQAGHRVVFDDVESGSYIENKVTGVKTWLKQEGGVFFLDLWVSPVSTFHGQGNGM
jgi:hypothetical protein